MVDWRFMDRDIGWPANAPGRTVGNLRDSIALRSGEIRAQGDNADASKLLLRQHRAIPRHDELRARREGALQNPIVRFVGEDRQRLVWLDEFPHLEEKDGDACERFAIMGKLSCENTEKLIENGPGKDKCILAVDNLAKRLVTSPAWQRQSRYQHVRIEYHPHARRYRRRSSSVRIPCSFALRLQ